MKKIIKAIILFLMFIMISSVCFAQSKKKIDPLDAAIRETSDYLNANIAKGSKIVILNIQSDSGALSEYIIDELVSNAVNDRIFLVVDRQQLDAIRAEQNFQFSGEVDDKQALAIGKFFGAQTIVSGAMGPYGKDYRFRVRALEVQTALVQGQFNKNIIKSAAITTLLKTKSSTSPASASGGKTTTTAAKPIAAAPVPAPAPAAPPAPTYKIGDKGPAGGIIFYDKGNNSGGWRYLEAAPANTEIKAQFGRPEAKTRDDVGSGRENTQNLKIALEASGDITMAAHRCTQLNINGYTDWFLPSKAELSWMYVNLKEKGLGGLSNDWYWSSSNGGYDFRWWGQKFSDGTQSTTTGENNSNDRKANLVRAIRQF